MLGWPMVEIGVQGNRLELQHYPPDATVAALCEAVEGARRAPGLKTVGCHVCGECCRDPVPLLGYDIERLAAEAGVPPASFAADFVVLPERPDLEQRRRTIADMARQHGLTASQATMLYEHNNGEPPLLAKKGAGGPTAGPCVFLVDLLCSIYAAWPFICQLYVCNMGPQLEAVFDTLVRQGVWHAYHLLGWVPAADLAHNPCLHHRGYDDLPLAALETDLRELQEQLFFYF